MPDFKASLRKTIVQNAIFTGAGLNDLTSGGTYTGGLTAIYTIVIDTTGGTDTFQWKKDNGAYVTGVNCAITPITLSDGVTVVFGAITGHTLGDQWQVEIKSEGVDAELSANGEVLTIIDRSNYTTNTEVGHAESAFSDYRKIYIYAYGAVTKTTITSLSHWNSVTASANTDTFATAISADDVYELELVTVPTWNVALTYAVDDCVYYSAKLYQALTISIGAQPNTSPANWVIVAEADLPTPYFAKNNTVALVYNILKCKDEKVFGGYGDINKIVNSQFSINEYAVNLWKIGVNIRAIQIGVSLEEWARAQQTIKDTVELCTKCIAKTCCS